jgi:hypothetical protein
MANEGTQLQGWRWWAAAIGGAIAVSAVLHVIAAAVIFLTPLKEVIFPKSQYVQPVYSPDLIEETADDIRRDTARRIRLKTGELQQILEMMAEIRDFKHKAVDAGGGTLITPDERRSRQLPVKRMDSLYDLYNAARMLENGCYDVYEGLRAVTLADIQKVPLEQARQVSKGGNRPNRRPAKRAALEDTIRALPKFREFRSEVIFVKNEVESILVSAQRMRDLADGLRPPELGGTQNITWEQSGTLYQGGGGQLEWGATVGPSLLADEIFPSGASRLTRTDFRPQAGRKITADGQPMKWMFIDRWYCIGPFDNPGRKNLDKKFPPESVVDLDARYVGKGDRALRWRLLVSPGLCIAPIDVDKYAIYYCYTEIWSDEEKDYWVAFGSDDYGKIWVNGKLVWASGKTPHHWIPDRGFRKIRFNKGPNRVLFKIENAGGTMGFSMVLAVAPKS